MSNCSLQGLELLTSTTQSSLFTATATATATTSTAAFGSFSEKFGPTILKFPSISPPPFFLSWTLRTRARGHSFSTSSKASVTNAEVEEQGEVKVAEGHTITQFCDKIIDFFLNEKPRVREWRKYLVFREEWNKYRERFYTRCQMLDNLETDPSLKHKYTSLAAKVKRLVHGLIKKNTKRNRKMI